jgi:hypothetical protein
MASKDSPAASQAIVMSASAVCEEANHLWGVLKHVSIPTSILTDHREQARSDFTTEAMARAFLYQEIRELSQSELAVRLKNRPSLLKGFGLEYPPRQQTISDIWKKFSPDSRQIIRSAATGIALEANEQGIIPDALVPSDPKEEADEDESKAEYTKQKATKTIRLARKHAFPEFESGRALNRTYDDEAVLDMVARICEHKGSAHSEGEYGWLTDDDLTADGSTILRVLKQFATPTDGDAQLTIDELLDDDRMPAIDRIRDELMSAFDSASENIINSIRGDTPFDDREKIAAIDITYERIWTSPWEDRERGIVNTTFPRMASGYKKDDEYKRGFKYATITLVGDMAPIILGIEPVKEKSNWEEDDAPSYSKAGLVARLLDSAQQYVDLDAVMFDRGFYSKEVYAAVEDRGLTYLSPVPKYTDELESIEDIKTTDGVDAGVKHDVPMGLDGEIHHTAEFIYTPVDDDDADGNYGVYVTNRNHVAPDEINAVVDQYNRRWDIENQYKSIEALLPRTSSMDYRVRFTNFVLTALLYNLWRLTDYLIKVGKNREIRSPPEVGFRTFVRALGSYLREIG